MGKAAKVYLSEWRAKAPGLHPADPEELLSSLTRVVRGSDCYLG